MAARGNVALAASIDSAKVVASLLTCIASGKKGQEALVEATATGIVVTTRSRAKSMQAQGHLKAELFSPFRCDADVSFRVCLSTLLDCLTVFGSASLAATSLSLAYEPDRGVFSLTLEDAGVVTACELRTLDDGAHGLDAEVAADYAALFRRSETVARAILKSEALRDAFAELSELPGAVSLTVCMAPESPQLALSAAGTLGCCDVEFPGSSDAFVELEVQRRVESRYQMSAVQQAMKALAVANETFIRINEDALLCVQHMITTPAGQASFVDFLCCADEPDG